MAPGEATASANFVVDDVTALSFDVNADIETLVTRILSPTGDVITPANVADFGGTFEQYTVQPGTIRDIVIVPQFSAETHYLYQFGALAPGTYTVEYEVPSGVLQEVNVITQMVLNSPVQAALFPTEPVIPLGSQSVLSAALFEGSTAVPGSAVDVTVVTENQSPITLTLADDGSDADDLPGDGLYTGTFTPSAAGTYTALAVMNGATSSGVPFTRQAATRIEVVAPAGSILNGSIQDQGVDDNGNGLFDRIQIDVGINAVESGMHLAYVTLRTTGGQSLVRNGRITTTGGSATIPVNFSADALRDLGEDGPYAIERVELVFVGPNGTVPSDRLLDAGQTQAYLLSNFERPAILLTGSFSDTPRDTDGNGLFDFLDVTVDVNLISGGFYQWSGRLVDDLGNEIEFVGSSGFLSSGNTSIALTFDGRQIGENGVDGPYVLTDLLMFSSSTGANLVASGVAVTAPYDVERFEGVPARCPADVLSLTSFDADQGTSDTEEFVTVTNTGTERVLVTDCALVFYDGFGETPYYALDLQGAVDPGATHVVGNPGVNGVAQTFPINTLQDGPDAIALYQRPASDFPPGTGLITDETLLSAIVYVSDDEIFGAKSTQGSVGSLLLSLRDLVQQSADVPEVVTLDGNWPNPMRTSTQIRFGLPRTATVSLELYDVLGRRVMNLLDANMPAGWHTTTLNGDRLASGTYFYRLRVEDTVIARPLSVVR